MFKIYLSFCHDNKKSNKWSYFLALKYIKVQIPYFSMRQNKYYVIGAKRKFRHSTERRSTDIQIRLNFNNNARLLSLCYRWRIWRNSNQIINQESLQRKRSCFNLYVFIKNIIMIRKINVYDFIDISIFPDWSDQWSKAFNIAKIVTTTVPYCRQEKSYFYVSHLVQQQNVKKTEFLHTNQMSVNGINLYFLKWPTKSRNPFVDLYQV